MSQKTEYPIRLLLAGVLLLQFLLSSWVVFTGPASIVPLQVGDSFLIALLLAQAVFGTALLLGDQRPVDWQRLLMWSENLFLFGLVLFLFAYIFASNANMDYVQRFAASSGHLDLAPDTSAERWIAVQRFGPSLVVLFVFRLFSQSRLSAARGKTGVGGASLLVLLSVALSVVSFPSFLSVNGWGWIGWFMLVPLFTAIRLTVIRGDPSRRIFRYGVLYGVLFTLLGNYWLGTFSLVSLQLVTVIFFIFYALFFAVVALVLPWVKRGVWLVLPLLWTFFEFARSSGFLGYPWLLLGHSQYRFFPVIQYASVGGVWMVGTIVLVVNALLAEGVVFFVSGERRNARVWWGAVPVVLVSVILFGFGIASFSQRAESTGSTVRVALIQQNSDPRKHDYSSTLETLQRLSDEALKEDPDLIVWSETAFVPNIRRWSREDPRRYRLAELVRTFLMYQSGLNTWLLTGNDDYRRVLDEEGTEIDRLSFNAAVLFDDDGNRRETYHKIKLVPFTETFPYEDRFPRIYRMLLNFDVHFWEPGDEFTVFHHPKFRFATPICFEDAFPGHVRRFVLDGAQAIVNISNDYWSLTEVAGTQHFVAGMFRAVELRVPVLRASASGLTGVVDSRGRILDTRPHYSEEYIVTDISIRDGNSLYRRWGDWFPRASLALAVILLLVNVVSETIRRKRGAPDGS